MRASDVRQIIVMHEIVTAEISELGVGVPQQHFAALVHGYEAEVELVLALEHHLLLRHLQQRRRTERRA